MQTNSKISCANATISTSLLPISSCPDAPYIEHPVSKFDTLAGVAIKYGVDVADIKKMNALVTDFQMFALKSLQIPTPGKHPPPPPLFDDLDVSRKSCEESSTHPDLFDSFSLRVKSSSPTPGHHSHIQAEAADQKNGFVDSERITTYGEGKFSSKYLEVDPTLETTPHSNRNLSHHRKSKSLINCFLDETGEFTNTTTSSNVGGADSIKGNDKVLRRRQKSVADFSTATEKIFRSDKAGNDKSFLDKTKYWI